jgi:hypothetical protein
MQIRHANSKMQMDHRPFGKLCNVIIPPPFKSGEILRR